MPFTAIWIQLEIIIKVKLIRRERQIPHDFTYRWNLNYDTNEPIYETETDPETLDNRFMVAKREGMWRRD